MKALREVLLKDLARIGIDTGSMTLAVRPYHSRYHGRYLFDTSRAFVYVYADKFRQVPRPYEEVLETAIHEATHHMMAKEKKVARGETHNAEFRERYGRYVGLATRLGLMKPQKA